MRFPVMVGFVMKRKRRKICFILLLSILISTAAAIVKLFPGDDDPNIEGLSIAVNKTIFAPGDKMRITVGITASHINAPVTDAYLAVQDPSGKFSFYYDVPGWIVVDSPPTEIASIPLKTIGPYSLFFVLCHPGLDPFDPKNWAAGVHEQVFLLPGNGVSSTCHNTLSFSHGSEPVLIAHGAGEIEGIGGTNTREALDHNYAKGHRYFEIDFCWTSDKCLVLIHDWHRTFTRLFMDTDEQPTLERFESIKMKRNMTQMSLNSLYRWLSKHNDAYIITDVKDQNLTALALIAMTAGTLKDQFIPQIYGLCEFKPVKELGFKDVILTLYRTALTDAELLEFVTRNKVFAVTMPTRKAFSFTRMQDLRQKGISVYAHTINQVEVLRYLRKQGVYGIYTDKLLPDDILR